MCRAQSEVLVQIWDMVRWKTLLGEDEASQWPEGRADGVQGEGRGAREVWGGMGHSWTDKDAGLKFMCGSLQWRRVSLEGCKWQRRMNQFCGGVLGVEELRGVLRCCRRCWELELPLQKLSTTEPFLAPGSVCRCHNAKTRVRVSFCYCGKRKSWDEGNRRGLQRNFCRCCRRGCLHVRSCFCPSILACPLVSRRKALQNGPFPLPVLGHRESWQVPTPAALRVYPEWGMKQAGWEACGMGIEGGNCLALIW